VAPAPPATWTEPPPVAATETDSGGGGGSGGRGLRLGRPGAAARASVEAKTGACSLVPAYLVKI